MSVNGFVADGTLSPGVVGEREIVQDAGPAEDVTASSDLGSRWWIQTGK